MSGIDQIGTEPEDEIALYCGRQSCGKVIVQAIGRGRRKEFCSETCRRVADKEYKRAKSHAELFDEQLRRARYQVASYGRKPDPGVLTPEESMQAHEDARVALVRASTVLELGAGPERVLEELGALVAAIRPLLDQGTSWQGEQTA